MICDKCGNIEITYQKTKDGRILCLDCCTEYGAEYVDNYNEYFLHYLIENNLELALNIYLENSNVK